MLKIFNKIKFVLLGCALISAYVFAQGTDTWALDNSAVKRATAGQFSTDSDKIKSKDIFDLQRSFLTAGYLGGGSFSTTGNGTDDALANAIGKMNNNAIQGAFGIALPNNMYLGFAAKYKFDDGANISKDKDKNVNGNQYTINSQAAMRVAFRINEMAALHYYFGLQPNGGSQVNYSVNKITGKDNKSYIINHNAMWTHEIAASIKFGEHKLTIPVGIVFHSDHIKTKSSGKQQGENLKYYSANYGDNDYISLYLNPEFNLALAAGPMTGINVGANIGFGVNNNYGENYKQTSGSQEYKKESKQGKDRFAGDLYASFPLKWSLADDRVQLAMEPKVSLGVAVTNTGNINIKVNNAPSQGKVGYTSEVKFIPYAELPIGTTWRPAEWWELRAGTALMIQAETTWTTTIPSKAGKPQELDEANKTVSTLLTTRAGIAGFFGMGFIVGEDFNIDLFAEVSKLNISTLSFGGQLTYRFN